MGNWVTGIILLAIIGAAAAYVVRTKKNGRKCIGCPNASCPYRGKSDCGCGGENA